MADITPSNEQYAAIKQIVDWYGDGEKVFYLAGYAGVGKSTICSIAIDEIKKRYGIDEVYTATYTGKAASVLRKKGVDASTIHSLIYVPKFDKRGRLKGFFIDEESPATMADLIVLDECSMISDELAEDLLSFDKKILVMGDPGQLPPVKGQGYFTRNKPDVFLQEIHRQCADSPIIKLATMARNGETITPGYLNDANIITLKLNQETQSHIYNQDTQVICGLNRVRHTVTQKIRKHLGFRGELPLKGERVICCKNHASEGLFNGIMGVMLSDAVASELPYGSRYFPYFKVEMDDYDTPHELNVDPYLFDLHFGSPAPSNSGMVGNGRGEKIIPPKNADIRKFDEFDWGYAITCHKAQGSQWDHVTIIDDSSAFRENKNSWLYTAITRPSTGLTLLMR